MSQLATELLSNSQLRIDHFLNEHLSAKTSPYGYANTNVASEPLLTAMRYSSLNGGKRIRPALVYATAHCCQARQEDNKAFDYIAAAIECIHAYSLIHDDLPAMDDDDLRRGQPSCHKQFNEATAILAGDALQTEAFLLISQAPDLAATAKVDLVQTLAQASGWQGMIGGQMIDLNNEDKSIDLEALQAMHALKTGALIRASIKMSAIACQATSEQSHSLDTFAHAIGLAFQIQDDILDIESDTQTLGKQQGADLALDKSTFPKLLGLDGAKKAALEQQQRASDALKPFGESAKQLHAIGDFIIHRPY